MPSLRCIRCGRTVTRCRTYSTSSSDSIHSTLYLEYSVLRILGAEQRAAKCQPASQAVWEAAHGPASAATSMSGQLLSTPEAQREQPNRCHHASSATAVFVTTPCPYQHSLLTPRARHLLYCYNTTQCIIGMLFATRLLVRPNSLSR